MCDVARTEKEVAEMLFFLHGIFERSGSINMCGMNSADVPQCAAVVAHVAILQEVDGLCGTEGICLHFADLKLMSTAPFESVQSPKP